MPVLPCPSQTTVEFSSKKKERIRENINIHSAEGAACGGGVGVGNDPMTVDRRFSVIGKTGLLATTGISTRELTDVNTAAGAVSLSKLVLANTAAR